MSPWILPRWQQLRSGDEPIRQPTPRASVVTWRCQADPNVDNAAVAKYADDFHYGFPLLLDPAQLLVKHAGATITPQAAIFTADGGLLYLGASITAWRTSASRARKPPCPICVTPWTPSSPVRRYIARPHQIRRLWDFLPGLSQVGRRRLAPRRVSERHGDRNAAPGHQRQEVTRRGHGTRARSRRNAPRYCAGRTRLSDAYTQELGSPPGTTPLDRRIQEQVRDVERVDRNGLVLAAVCRLYIWPMRLLKKPRSQFFCRVRQAGSFRIVGRTRDP